MQAYGREHNISKKSILGQYCVAIHKQDSKRDRECLGSQTMQYLPDRVKDLYM